MSPMKTTVDLPDALYRRARIRAAERGTTLRELLIESLEAALSGRRTRPPALPTRDRFTLDDRGWPVLRPRPGDDRVITDELIDRLREEEGI
jgi:hypothetical protein